MERTKMAQVSRLVGVLVTLAVTLGIITIVLGIFALAGG